MTILSVIGLPVMTRSNVLLGHVGNVRIDADSHTIVQYEVCARSSGHLWTRCRNDRTVHTSQVVRVDATRMIVNDLVEEKPEQRQQAASLGIAPAQSTMSHQ